MEGEGRHAATGAVENTGRLGPGDVLFFYTQRIHRAPPPDLPRYIAAIHTCNLCKAFGFGFAGLL